jgi:hypothetical protein
MGFYLDELAQQLIERRWALEHRHVPSSLEDHLARVRDHLLKDARVAN